jgi:ABC-type Mn2+/Zn2+ transport system permease subunit
VTDTWGLFHLYAWAIGGAAAYAALLGFVGAHLAGRDRALQTIATAQAGVFGIVVGLALAALAGEPHPPYGMPLATAIVAAAAVYGIGDWAARRWPASRGTTFVSLYAACVALGNLVAGVVPGLEAHLAQLYAGDVATVSDVAARVALGLAALLGGLALRFRRKLLEAAIDAGLYGRADGVTERLFVAAVLVVLAFGVGTFGLLFTLAMLFLPTALLARALPGGARLHLAAASVTAALGALVGFAVSLRFPTLPTAPTAAVATVLAAVALAAGARWAHRARRFLFRPALPPEEPAEDSRAPSVAGADSGPPTVVDGASA